MALAQTLDSLKDVSTKVSLPSTLSYKERRHLAANDPVEYKRVYHTAARDKNVWERLLDDNATRKKLPAQQYSFVGGTTALSAAPQGYAQSVKGPDEVDPIVDPPVSAVHHTTLEKNRKGHPVEFYSTIRPSTKTMTQTLRVLGTYASDLEFAKEHQSF